MISYSPAEICVNLATSSIGRSILEYMVFMVLAQYKARKHPSTTMEGSVGKIITSASILSHTGSDLNWNLWIQWVQLDKSAHYHEPEHG